MVSFQRSGAQQHNIYFPLRIFQPMTVKLENVNQHDDRSLAHLLSANTNPESHYLFLQKLRNICFDFSKLKIAFLTNKIFFSAAHNCEILVLKNFKIWDSYWLLDVLSETILILVETYVKGQIYLLCYT